MTTTTNYGMDPTDNAAQASSMPFCIGGMHSTHGLLGGSDGMIMYMDGFHLSLKGNQPCLNLFFPSWTLDTREKFVGAMFGVMFMAVLTEGISKLRFIAQLNLSSSSHRRWTITFLHGLQAFVGYILMLATMTFSVELFFCVLVGLGSGYAIFYNEEDTHVTTNPCCNFIQNEADERTLGKNQEETIQENESRSDQESTTEVDFEFPHLEESELLA